VGAVESGCTVLVVDDEALVRGLVRAALAADGYDVLEAAGPDEAQEIARAYPGRIDLVLTDVRMPGMGGNELVPLLTARRPGLRALYMSGYVDVPLSQVTPLIEKPFALAELVSAVRDVLAEPRAA
jgi:DNA-binding NtrC family response regulator